MRRLDSIYAVMVPDSWTAIPALGVSDRCRGGDRRLGGSLVEGLRRGVEDGLVEGVENTNCERI